MSEEMNGKSFSITWLFWPGLILVFIALISILSWSPPEDSNKNTDTRVLKEYTPPPSKPIYQPLPDEKPAVKSEFKPLPKPKEPKPNIKPLPNETPKKLKPNYQSLKEAEK